MRRVSTSPPPRSVLRRRPVVAWAFYDWANSAFATTVMAGFFPVFFKQYWNAGVVATESRETRESEKDDESRQCGASGNPHGHALATLCRGSGGR